MNVCTQFIKQILTFGNFRSSSIPRKYYRELLTGLEKLKRIDTVFIPEFIKLAKNCEGKLVIDDTNHPKYGLKNYTRKIKNLKTNGYENGFKLLLFLWEGNNFRIPLGFALWHKDSNSINDLALAGLSRIRNEFKLKPKVVLADGAFSIDKIVKRLTDYGWGFVFRWRKNRKLSGTQIKKQIPRAYGNSIGLLKNNTKVKIFRRKNRFYQTNRMLLTMQDMVRIYKLRWTIEETFKVLKHCIGINRCQQHSVILQEIFIWMCCLSFSYLERIKNHSVYKTRQTVNFQNVNIDKSVLKEVLAIC
jgi:IS4 transposase